jgi:hypothetical protein
MQILTFDTLRKNAARQVTKVTKREFETRLRYDEILSLETP